MVIKPKIKGSIALNCHPMGCKKAVENQITYVKSSDKYSGGKKALILGASSGYGLASRVSLAFGSNCDTIGVSFEKAGTNRKVGSSGWYNNIAFKGYAEKEGLIAKNFNGDAFSHEMKNNVIKYIKEEFGGKIDIVVYSLASGRRIDPDTGETYWSSLKPRETSLTGPTFNVEKEELEYITLEPATEDDIKNTVKVMGGEDWELWIKSLLEADVLSERCKTIAYSYIGKNVTRRIYREGTIGAAKEHLESTAKSLDKLLKEKVDGEAYIGVDRAIISKASAYIPIFPLYAAILFPVMESKNLQENAIEHTHRLFKDMIYGDKAEFDEKGRLRPDNWEMKEEIQEKVSQIYNQVNKYNFKTLIDFPRYKKEFLQINGFSIDGVNYEEDIDLESLEKLEI